MEDGFRPAKKIYRLNFVDDEELAGLIAEVRSVSVDEYNKMLTVSMERGLTPETLEANNWLLDLFGERLEKWNLRDPDSGRKVPPTPAGVRTQERTLVAKVITAWQLALVRVSLPLSNGSSDGGISEEQSLGLVSESPNPES
jgi:hypothetical protein